MELTVLIAQSCDCKSLLMLCITSKSCQAMVVLGKFSPGPIGTQSGPDQTPRSRSRSGIFLKTPDRLVSSLGIPILPETVSDLVWTGTA